MSDQDAASATAGTAVPAGARVVAGPRVGGPPVVAGAGKPDRPRRIVVVGSINMDLVATSDRLPRPGETVSGTGFATAPGGKGSNQAIAAARAGGDEVAVTMVGAVGDDAFADALLARLGDAGVRTELVRRATGASGIAQITVDGRGENTIVVVPGANGALSTLTDPELAAIRGADLVMLQLEIPLAGVVQAAGAAHDAGVPVLLNPSPVTDLPAELCTALTLAVVNEGEAAALGTSLDEVPVVVTTLGSRGARYAARGRTIDDGPTGARDATAGESAPSGRLTVEVPAPRVRAVDTTGAGDAFTGALAVAWLEGRSPADVLRYACAAGALAATVAGASSSPTRDAIARLAAGAARPA